MWQYPFHNLTLVSRVFLSQGAGMPSTNRAAVVRSATATVMAELAFTRADGSVGAAVVTPLTDADDVVVALPYAERALADRLAAAEAVALVMSDARMTLSGWEPLGVIGRMEVEADPDGRRFRETLVDDELRKHPPSRLLADSLIARHEHWWFLPRLLCRFTWLDRIRAVTPRQDPASGVLAWWTPDGLDVATVEPGPLGDADLRLRSLSGELLGGAGDPACLIRHDFSTPDLERRTLLVERGRLEGDALRVTEREGTLTLPDPPSLLSRLRRHRAFARACRRELRRAR